MRKLAVSFIPEIFTNIEKGQTHTNITEDLKILYVRIVFDDKDIEAPVINTGYITNFMVKRPGKRWTGKFEKMMSHITYNDQRLFIEPGKVDYEDAHVKFNGKFIDNYLYDLIDSETLNEKVIVPTLKIYRTGK